MTTACRKKEKNNRITDKNKTITNTNSLTRVKVTPVIHNNENANNQARDRFMEVLDNIPSIPINPNVFFSTTLAKGAKIIPCIGDGNCWYDGMVKDSETTRDHTWIFVAIIQLGHYVTPTFILAKVSQFKWPPLWATIFQQLSKLRCFKICGTVLKYQKRIRTSLP